MVNVRLLEKALEEYKKDGIDMQPIKYTKELFKNLFDNNKDYGMFEYLYCCYGLEQSCWVEVVEEGNWDLTLEQVKIDILKNIKKNRKYLYNEKKYGKNRLYIGEKDSLCYVYIYLRDQISVDYLIWFFKN